MASLSPDKKKLSMNFNERKSHSSMLIRLWVINLIDDGPISVLKNEFRHQLEQFFLRWIISEKPDGTKPNWVKTFI